jgi:hypothetical protein
MQKLILRNKKIILLTTIMVCSLLLLLSSFGDNKYPDQAPSKRNYETDPPKASKITATRLQEVTPNGENMQMQIEYLPGEVEGGKLAIYPNGKEVILYDDGTSGGDTKAGDNVFSGFISENLDAFVQQMSEFDETLARNNNELEVFEGRTMSKVKRDKPFFDKAAFERFEPMELSTDIFNLPPDVGVSPIPKLLIEKAKTNGDYNPGGIVPAESLRSSGKINTPNPYKHIGFGPAPPLPFPLLKTKSLYIFDTLVTRDPARTFNPCTGVGNPNGAWTFGTLIKNIANQSATLMPAKDLLLKWVNNWMVNVTVNGEVSVNRSARMLSLCISRWLKKANNNAALVVTAANWTTIWASTPEANLLKFAPFGLRAIVNRLDLRGNFGYGSSGGNAGETRFIFSMIQNTMTGLPACRDSIGSGGLDGFNAILEYGNVQPDCPSVQAFAQKWADLSNPALSLTNYLIQLEAITNTVTLAGSNPSRPTNNFSAINQVRTNEIALSNSVNTVADRSPRWQFREFKINGATKLLEQSPLFNEPAAKYNGADGGSAGDVAVLANWVNTNSAAIIAQSTSGEVPLTIGVLPFRAGKTNYPSTSPFLAPGFWNANATTPIISDFARQKFSQNTCNGCHSAETRTDFTMHDYRGQARPGAQFTAMSSTVSILISGANHRIDISPFLTGRDANFNGSIFVFGDDSTSVAEDATDNTLTGTFWVRDPAGRTYPGTGIVRKWGFNDLERRAQDLTNLLNSSCRFVSPVFAIEMARIATFQPLNMAH